MPNFAPQRSTLAPKAQLAPSRPGATNYKIQTLYALTIAFGIVFLLHVSTGKLSLWKPEESESTLRNTFRGDTVSKSFIAWGFLAVVLFSMAAFDSTAPLSAAMAWLILFSVLLMNADLLLRVAGYVEPLGAVTGKGGGTGGGVNKLNRPL